MNRSEHHARRLDTLFEMLSHPCRRRILDRVHAHDPREAGGLGVADVLAGSEGEWATHTEFHHVHAPKLAEAGYIEWDADAGRIRRGPHFAEVAPVIELFVEHGDQLPAEWP